MGKLNKQQKEFLALRTCYILDQNSNFEEELKSHGIPKKIQKKINKAFDLIHEVNQMCHKKKK